MALCGTISENTFDIVATLSFQWFYMILKHNKWCFKNSRTYFSELGQQWFRQGLVACSAPSHDPYRCLIIANWTLSNIHQWNLNKDTNVLIYKNALYNIICEIATILFDSSVDIPLYYFRIKKTELGLACSTTQIVWLLYKAPRSMSSLLHHKTVCMRFERCPFISRIPRQTKRQICTVKFLIKVAPNSKS